MDTVGETQEYFTTDMRPLSGPAEHSRQGRAGQGKGPEVRGIWIGQVLWTGHQQYDGFGFPQAQDSRGAAGEGDGL